MVEPEQKDKSAANLEDTVRNLREENAKLMQLLRSQGMLLDPMDEKATDASHITFDGSEISLTTNSVNTTNQVTHQHVNNHGPVNQQNYSGQIVHGNQANITPNFNTVIQTASQPFVQNNSNTLVQNNTNLIQPINLVNFNNVSLDSLQSFFASQNNLLYLSQSSSSSSLSTTTTTTTTTSNLTHESEQHQISIRPKPSIAPAQPPVDIKPTESVLRQLSSSSLSSSSSAAAAAAAATAAATGGETTNLLDNDLNHKQPRPIRPKPSARANALQVYAPVVLNETKPITGNVLTPSALINNTNASSTVSLLSPSTSFEEHHLDLSPQLMHSKSVDSSLPPTNNLLSSTKKTVRNRKKPLQPLPPPPTTTTTTVPMSIPTVNQSLIPIAPNPGRPLAPAPLNVQRVVATNKRTMTTTTANKKRTSKTLMSYHSESIIQQAPSPTNSFAESISGLMQNFDQELQAANFLSQPTPAPPPTTNILSNETSSSSSSSSNVNLIRTLDNIDVRQIVSTSIHRTDSSFHSMPTFDEFNERLEHETNPTISDYGVDSEQITSFMNEEDMRFVEMNFDENTFLKQFDLDDAGIKLNITSEQNLFASLLTNPHQLTTSMEPSSSPLSLPQPPPPPIYPGSSLINNNVYTTVVPLGLQQQSSHGHAFNSRSISTACLPEEGVQLTARHIEPSQVATYESVKYQDILDDLVTVTDQDVLSHVQAAAAAANDAAVISTDFSFALIEATNEIIKSTNIEGAEETASAFVDLQYFYPIEQEQELLQKQLEECHETVKPELSPPPPPPPASPPPPEPPAMMLEEKFDVEMSSAADSPKSEDDSAITDLASILQINQTQAPSPMKEAPTVIDFDSLLPPPTPPPPPPPVLAPPPVLPVPTMAMTKSEFPPVPEPSSRKACIIFEPILSPINPSTPEKPPENELVLDSGCLPSSSDDKPDPLNTNQIEELLNEATDEQFEVVENEGQTASPTDSPANLPDEPLEQLVEQVEEPVKITSEKSFLHYQHMYQESQKKATPPKEQYSPIPSVKLKLNSIYPKPKKKRKTSPVPSPSPPPPPPPPPPPSAPVLVCEPARPSLKIKIRTKLPSPPPPAPEEELSVPKLKIKKLPKKPKRKKTTPEDELEREAKLSLKTEYAGLTRFEQPLAQLYRTHSSPDTRVPPTPGENEDLPTVPNKQDTPPTNEPKLHSTASPENHMKKLAQLLNYDDEPLNNNTFITPPPEIDAHLHQQQQHKTSNDYQHSPKKMKKLKAHAMPAKEYYPPPRKTEHLPPPPPPQPPPPAAPMHLDPYAQPYHQFDPRTAPFFNFPFPNPFMNPHSAPPTSHFHPNAVKYHYPPHAYPAHQQQFPYHPHLQRQQQYNSTNYMSSRSHHPFNR